MNKISEKKLKEHIKKLKTLAGFGTNPQKWYNIKQEVLNTEDLPEDLKIILNSEKQCKLIPKISDVVQQIEL